MGITNKALQCDPFTTNVEAWIVGRGTPCSDSVQTYGFEVAPRYHGAPTASRKAATILRINSQALRSNILFHMYRCHCQLRVLCLNSRGRPCEASDRGTYCGSPLQFNWYLTSVVIEVFTSEPSTSRILRLRTPTKVRKPGGLWEET